MAMDKYTLEKIAHVLLVQQNYKSSRPHRSSLYRLWRIFGIVVNTRSTMVLRRRVNSSLISLLSAYSVVALLSGWSNQYHIVQSAVVLPAVLTSYTLRLGISICLGLLYELVRLFKTW